MKIYYEGKELQVKDGQKVVDIFKNEIEKSENIVIACKCNNELRSLNLILNETSKIELIDISSKDGLRTYVRGIMYIMSKAFHDVCPSAKLTINYQLSNAMYCQIENIEVTDELIKNVKIRMQEIIDKDIPIRKVKMTKEEAEDFYKKEKSIRGKLQIDKKQEYGVSLYYCEDYYNYFYGIMPISTGVTKIFDIMKYKNGFLVRYPNRKTPNRLTPYLENKKLLATLTEYDEIYKVLKIHTISKLNEKIRRGEATECILLAEALHEKKMAHIADKIAENKNIKMILIAGPSSSGKTTFAQRLGIQLRLNGIKPVTISVDNYFVERDKNPKDEQGNYDFECIEAIDTKLFNEHLTKLLNGESVLVPKFDFKIGTKIYDGTTMQLKEDEVLVIEGIHCLNDKLTEKIDKENKYKIYLSDLTVLNIDYYNRISSTDTRLIRRIVRDHNTRGYSAINTIKMWNQVNKGEEKNIFPFQEEADMMFNSSLVYELAVLKDYAIPLLKEIDNSNEEYSEAVRLIRFLSYFESMPISDIPTYSLIREFIGGSIFESKKN